MKAHLLKHLTEGAKNHASLAKCCKALSGHFAGLVEKAKKSEMENGVDLSALCDDVSHEFAMMNEAHTMQAENCLECAKALKASHKAAMGDELDEIMPSPISRVVPTVPQTFAVPRFGSRPIPGSENNPMFEKIYGAGTDE